MENKIERGFLVVIDGTDGTGKETQANLLVDNFQQNGFDVETTDFPQYGKKSAELVEKYLRGEFGPANEVCPFLASTFYTKDRLAASNKIHRWLNEGKIVVSNRYTSANMGHQGGKIKSSKGKDFFFDWLLRYEHDYHKIPRPDINLLLFSNPKLSQKLVDKKEQRSYLRDKKRDIHENEKEHLSDSQVAFFYAAKKYNWIAIDCINPKTQEMRQREEISKEIWEKISNRVLSLKQDKRQNTMSGNC